MQLRINKPREIDGMYAALLTYTVTLTTDYICFQTCDLHLLV